jgi:hypothetical protein
MAKKRLSKKAVQSWVLSKKRLNRFRAVSGDVWTRLNTAFGNILIPTDRVICYEDKMTVKRFTHEKQGWVAPMILTIPVK